jgi:hypothetical protein
MESPLSANMCERVPPLAAFADLFPPPQDTVIGLKRNRPAVIKYVEKRIIGDGVDKHSMWLVTSRHGERSGKSVLAG